MNYDKWDKLKSLFQSQVQQGSIDTGTGSEGFGFPTSRGSSCARHPWNLKILSNNPRSGNQNIIMFDFSRFKIMDFSGRQIHS